MIDIDIDIVISTWFTDVVQTIGITIFALNSLSIIVSGTDSSQSLITVGISLALVRDFLASMGVSVTEVPSLNLMVRWDFIKFELLHCSQSLTGIHRVDCRCRYSLCYSNLHCTGHSQHCPGTQRPRDR